MGMNKERDGKWMMIRMSREEQRWGL